MRIRHKPWAKPELESCSFYIAEPSKLRGTWLDEFGNGQPLHMELGCGKGGFIADMAVQHPAVNFLAIDLKSEMLVLAKRNLETKDPHTAAHVRLMSQDIERIDQMMAPEDQVERIYINFCPPWPKERDKKHRLTHPRQLNKYLTFLQEGGRFGLKRMMITCLKSRWDILINADLKFVIKPGIWLKAVFQAARQPNTKKCLLEWERK